MFNRNLASTEGMLKFDGRYLIEREQIKRRDDKTL